MTNNRATHYRIYLLTLWAEQSLNSNEPDVWRFGLKDPHSGQQRAYANLTALVTALLEEIAHTYGSTEGGNLLKDDFN